nr:hypothetical protein [Polymorphobacter sp.]
MITTPHRVRRHENGEHAGMLEHYFPDADEQGFYRLADPAIGSERHKLENAILTKNISVAIHLVREHGFSIRMRGNLTKQWNLIRREEIQDL